MKTHQLHQEPHCRHKCCLWLPQTKRSLTGSLDVVASAAPSTWCICKTRLQGAPDEPPQVKVGAKEKGMLWTWPLALVYLTHASWHCSAGRGGEGPVSLVSGSRSPCSYHLNYHLVHNLNLYSSTGLQKEYLIHKKYLETGRKRQNLVKAVLKPLKKVITTNTSATAR